MSRLPLLLALSLIAACGSVRANADAGPDDPDGGSTIDGGGGGGPDASVAPGVVTITLYQRGAPFPGGTVVFNAPDGSLVAQETTDAQGEASAEVEAGADVHVMWQRGERDFETTTILDVVPGDDLVVGDTDGSQGLLVGSVTFTLSGGGLLPAGTTNVVVEAGCTSSYLTPGTTTATLDVYDHCIRAGNVLSLIATARNDDGDALAFSTVADVTLAGSPLTANVTFPSWSTEFVERNVIVNDAPLDLQGFSIEGQIFAHGHGFQMFGPSNDAPPAPGGSGSYDLWFAPGVADSEAFTFFVVRGAPGQLGASLYLRGAPTLSPSTVVDFDDILMPLVHSTQFLAGDVIWDSEGAQTEADALAIQVYFGRGTSPNDESYNWTLIGPPTATPPFALPTLPAGFTDRMPQPGDDLQPPQVIFLDVIGEDGYDNYRRGLGVLLFGNSFPANTELRASFAGQF